MLVLTRKIGQKIIINDNIEVVILETKGDAAKIGIRAPKNVTIYREEIYDEIKKANEQSGKNTSVSDLNTVMSMFATQQPNVGGFANAPKAIIKSTDKRLNDTK